MKISVFIALVFLLNISVVAQQIKTIPVAHSHNDYTRKYPLFDALENGFTSIEIDVFERKGKFLVAHTVLGIRKNKTIEKLYLERLKKIIEANNGTVYADDTTLVEVMIDLKGEWNIEKFKKLEQLFMGYASIFSVYRDGQLEKKAVKLIASGGADINWIKDNNPRIFSKDAGMGDITSNWPSDIIARNSAPYKSYFTWRGKGEMPFKEKEKLVELCRQAKQYNRKLRFWGCPNNEQVWLELLNAGVGWINIDELNKFKSFYWNKFLKK